MNTMRVGAEDGKLLVPVDLAGLVGGVYGATQMARLSRRQCEAVRGTRIFTGLTGGLLVTSIEREWRQASAEEAA